MLFRSSLGAQALNETLPRALALLPAGARPVVIHQAGAKNVDALKKSYASAGVAAEAVAFIDGMGAAYADADLVICRAGAMTVSEVACCGVAALFVPFPFAVDDHQTANAKVLSDKGAALLLLQRDLTPEALAAQLQQLTRAQCLALAEKARALAKPGAAGVVADACVALIKKS